MSIRCLIRPISLLLDLGKQSRSGTLRPKHSLGLVTLGSYCPKIRRFTIGVELTCYLEKVLFYIPLNKLARGRTLTICSHGGIVAINILCIFITCGPARSLTQPSSILRIIYRAILFRRECHRVNCSLHPIEYLIPSGHIFKVNITLRPIHL
jgi:hypothetical protein